MLVESPITCSTPCFLGANREEFEEIDASVVKLAWYQITFPSEFNQWKPTKFLEIVQTWPHILVTLARQKNHDTVYGLFFCSLSWNSAVWEILSCSQTSKFKDAMSVNLIMSEYGRIACLHGYNILSCFHTRSGFEYKIHINDPFSAVHENLESMPKKNYTSCAANELRERLVCLVDGQEIILVDIETGDGKLFEQQSLLWTTKTMATVQMISILDVATTNSLEPAVLAKYLIPKLGFMQDAASLDSYEIRCGPLPIRESFWDDVEKDIYANKVSFWKVDGDERKAHYGGRMAGHCSREDCQFFLQFRSSPDFDDLVRFWNSFSFPEVMLTPDVIPIKTKTASERNPPNPLICLAEYADRTVLSSARDTNVMVVNAKICSQKLLPDVVPANPSLFFAQIRQMDQNLTGERFFLMHCSTPNMCQAIPRMRSFFLRGSTSKSRLCGASLTVADEQRVREGCQKEPCGGGSNFNAVFKGTYASTGRKVSNDSIDVYDWFSLRVVVGNDCAFLLESLIESMESNFLPDFWQSEMILKTLTEKNQHRHVADYGILLKKYVSKVVTEYLPIEKSVVSSPQSVIDSPFNSKQFLTPSEKFLFKYVDPILLTMNLTAQMPQSLLEYSVGHSQWTRSIYVPTLQENMDYESSGDWDEIADNKFRLWEHFLKKKSAEVNKAQAAKEKIPTNASTDHFPGFHGCPTKFNRTGTQANIELFSKDSSGSILPQLLRNIFLAQVGCALLMGIHFLTKLHELAGRQGLLKFLKRLKRSMLTFRSGSRAGKLLKPFEGVGNFLREKIQKFEWTARPQYTK